MKGELSDRVDVFLMEIDKAIQWEWRWERLNRNMLNVINYGQWIVRIILLALASYKINQFGKIPFEFAVDISIEIAAVFIIGLPLLSFVMRYSNRQEVHDRTARKYEMIKLDLKTGQIDLDKAVEKYKEAYSVPTELIVKQTP